MQFPLRAVPKPNHGRIKPKAKDRGKITKEVYATAWVRSGGHCERCGVLFSYEHPPECAHLVRRWKLPETTAEDVAMLCGPSVNSNTCHNDVDYTKSGRAWAEAYRTELYLRKENEHE